jgi:ribonuclease G
MSKELVIGSNRHETKVAILEEDQLVEVYFQRANEYSLAGSIHKGRVTRVLPGMQSAFVDLGLERDTFLYVSDFFEEHDDIDTLTDDKPAPRNERSERSSSGGGRGERGGGRDRGNQERANNQDRDRAPQEAFVLPTEAHMESLGADEAASDQEEDEESDTPPPADGQSPTLTGEVRAGSEQQQQPRPSAGGDRGDDGRGGDRRGRRSRRRRRGGRDFPENKYARPNSGVSAPPSQSETLPTVEVPSSFSPEYEVAEPAATFTPVVREDVIVLPGESLAKYRSRPVVQPQQAAPPAALPVEPPPAAPEPVVVEATVVPTPVEPEPPAPALAPAAEAAIAEEAAEITVSDQVFSHQPTLPPSERDEALGRAASYLGVDRTSAAFNEREEERLRAERFLTDPSPVHLAPTHLDPEDLPEANEHELYAAEASLPELEDLAPEIEEALENGLDEPYVTLAETPDEGEAGNSQPQSAVLRDQGNRALHRGPRRMRRRRGGSGRFNNQGGNAATTPQGEAREPRAEGGRRESSAPREAREPRAEPAPVEEHSTERPERAAMPSISELLKPGQEIIVQIAKEPLGQKGARITSHIALPGRYVVFMPSVAHLGVSRKVSSEEERLRLKRILQTHREGTSGGFIVRTAGEGVPEEEIAADMAYLYSLWLDIRQKAEKKPAPALLHYDLDIVQRILRDQVTEEFKAIWVDNEDLYESVVNFMQRHQPALVNRVKMYTRSAPVFDAFNITQELEKALRPKVWLKSGGYIVINQTEALVAIDINTGKFVGKSNRLEDTIVKTNIEAVKEIVRQVRLRDLGGIIVVDFIDMDERKNRQRVMQALEEAMRSDKAPYKILQFNDFGLVAITRKRVKQSLERTLCSPCPHCEGAGYVKSVQTVIGEILVEAQKISKALEGKDVMLRVHPDVAKVLKAKDNQYLEELEEILARPVLVKSDPTLHNEKFDLG